MVFLTAGTNEQPFDRFVRAARELPGRYPLLVQFGASREAHGHGDWIDFLSWEEMVGAMRSADSVVAHAGAGSILLAHRCGKRPIVMPRRGALGEAVDDHQIVLAERLEELGLVTVVHDATMLAGALADGTGELAGGRSGGGQSALTRELRSVLHELTADRLAA